MKKLLVRLGLAAALIGGIGGVASATAAHAADPIPLPIGGGFWDSCHNTAVLGTVDCIVTSRDPGVQFLVHILDHHGVFVGQENIGDLFTGAHLNLLHTLDILGGQYNLGNGTDTGIGVTAHDPAAGDDRGAVVHVANNYAGPDGGQLAVFDNVSGHSVVIEWVNGDCAVEVDGHTVAPCVLRVVPIIPPLPYVPLP